MQERRKRDGVIGRKNSVRTSSLIPFPGQLLPARSPLLLFTALLSISPIPSILCSLFHAFHPFLSPLPPSILSVSSHFPTFLFLHSLSPSPFTLYSLFHIFTSFPFPLFPFPPSIPFNLLSAIVYRSAFLFSHPPVISLFFPYLYCFIPSVPCFTSTILPLSLPLLSSVLPAILSHPFTFSSFSSYHSLPFLFLSHLSSSHFLYLPPFHPILSPHLTSFTTYSSPCPLFPSFITPAICTLKLQVKMASILPLLLYR